jgi:hypothetical protein
MPDTRTVKKIFKWNPLTKRSQGRPKYWWEDNIKQDICQMSVKNCIVCVLDRGKWKEFVGKSKTFYNHERKFSASRISMVAPTCFGIVMSTGVVRDTTPLDITRPYTIFYRLLLNSASLRRH